MATRASVIQYNREREEHPDAWFRLNAQIYLDRARKELADAINAHVENVVIVDNATTAINCTLRAFPFKAGDAFLDTTHTYGAIQILCEDFSSRMRPDIERINLTIKLPIQSEEEVMKAYEEILEKHPNIKLAIIDHITSPSSILFPVARMCQLFHSKGLTVVVDGAHAFGQVPLDMEQIGADVYTSNIHKWGYSPRGAALYWFSEKSRIWVRPPNTSWEVANELKYQFFDQGTRDHVPSITARHGIQFYNAIGGMDKISKHIQMLADEIKRLLVDIGLEQLQVPLPMEAPNLKLFKIPPMSKYPYCQKSCWSLHRDMFADSNIFGIIALFDGAFWLRVCFQVYNDMDEMKALAELVRSFLEKNKD